MFLRKMLAAFLPVILCALACALCGWLEKLLVPGFLIFLLKGLIIGLCLSLVLPCAGVKSHTNGLCGWLLAGAGLVALTLAYQYIETIGVLHVPALGIIAAVNGNTVLLEGAFVAFLSVTAWMNHRR